MRKHYFDILCQDSVFIRKSVELVIYAAIF
ncbi:hypothetical protein BTTAP_90078 [Brochothrix thermosphacta]|nr:hypothetical protein BTTAP_90078 [Brochothrix thermosphacta]